MRTFELVLGGHPDKVCDIIAENIKELVGDNKAAVEVAWFNKKIIVGGEIGTALSGSDIENVLVNTLHSLGYSENDEEIEFENLLQRQSREIANIVKDVGAGDNGIFFAGYHKKWTPIIWELKHLANILTSSAIEYQYRTDGKFIATFSDDYELKEFTLNIASDDYQNNIDKKAFREYLDIYLTNHFNKDFKLLINPKGDWYRCGGFADSGLTGRKLACDNSLGLFHQGGGAFFGKDVSKADYSVPLYLQHKAEEYALKHELESVELKAHTIIGDEKVKIYTAKGDLIEEVVFTEIMQFARDNKMDWVGL